jgi:hypothetical protein
MIFMNKPMNAHFETTHLLVCAKNKELVSLIDCTLYTVHCTVHMLTRPVLLLINAGNLAFAASALGLDAYRISKGGWKLLKENVDKLLTDLKDLLSTLPPDTPVVIFCLDNTSFLGLSEDGSMNAISRCVEEDDGFHVKGALVVAPEKAMKYFFDQLKRITAECGSHPVFVLTPWLRFARVPCCDDAGHVTNFNEPDFLASLLSDLTKLKYQLRKAVTPAIVVDSLELICGNGYSHEKVAQAISAG